MAKDMRPGENILWSLCDYSLTSLVTSEAPDNWSKANVLPLFKKQAAISQVVTGQLISCQCWGKLLGDIEGTG